jgi:uncharacterized protein
VRPVTALLVVGLLVAGCTSGSPTASDDPTPSASPTRPAASDQPSRAPRATKPPGPVRQQELDTRLIAAAWADDVRRARRLVDRGADVNAEDETEQSAFLIATSEGHLELLELTLRRGADVRAKDSYNGTGLIRAAERGHWDVVGRLLQAGVQRDHVNELGWTALHEAVLLGDGSSRYVDTVRVLVAGGVDVTIPSGRDGSTPVQQATSEGYDEIAALLSRVDRNPPASRRAADRVLLRAASTGDADAAALALRAGARLEARDAHRRTPLLRAVTADHLPVARLLVALGADPDALDDRHDTPWLVTGVTGSVPMAELLLTAGPDLTIRNRFGGVSIIPASERGHVAYVRRVADTPIDVDHVNDLGWTALLEAVILGDGSSRYQRIVRILLEAGADPSITDHDGVAALEHAEALGQDEVARILRR